MIGYYLRLAWRSLRRTPVMSALMVLAIGLGIGASMTMFTVLHVMSGDPLPQRSALIYAPHLDPLPRDYQRSPYGPDPAVNFTWPDAMNLLKAARADRQAAMAGGRLLLRPAGNDRPPYYVDGRYTSADFFAMFGVPLLHGHGWSRQEDDRQARVLVLTASLSRQLFGSTQSVGRTVRLGEHDWQVIGVSADWAPRPLFYADASANLFSDRDGFFVPLSAAVALKLDTSGNTSSWLPWQGDMTRPGLSWLQFWVQLDSPARAAAYRRYLHDYAAQQQALGQFQRDPSSATLTPLGEWLQQRELVPADVRLQFWLACGFLLVCMVNIIALLLAKYLRRSGEVGVRRALGASQRDIFVQLAVESGLLGLCGGVLGVLLAQLGLWSVRHRPDDYAKLAQMDGQVLLLTVLVAVLASLLAGIVPAWRACRLTPGLQLKQS